MLKVEGKIKGREVSKNLPDNPFMEFPIEKSAYIFFIAKKKEKRCVYYLFLIYFESV